ncbi:uncharacterized protein MONBRDRAFT_30170 [Monosiga brevicollis MX1]|uniref:SH3 domain-containing protein n=1 Tax=Monosiga brevicollis TaxID=81824 RepID=A9VD74_MONBE|nr:uncharacterized protein MONBRDRAFT_30170 [Monosiga brevicollis MX1]EDQ84505.1 predicted protein [Monosiga brevicollis MX1]|eukprot:XP_001750692.1 hypothetical protein [Monosiga brevicollis MX1]
MQSAGLQVLLWLVLLTHNSIQCAAQLHVAWPAGIVQLVHDETVLAAGAGDSLSLLLSLQACPSPGTGAPPEQQHDLHLAAPTALDSTTLLARMQWDTITLWSQLIDTAAAPSTNLTVCLGWPTGTWQNTTLTWHDTPAHTTAKLILRMDGGYDVALSANGPLHWSATSCIAQLNHVSLTLAAPVNPDPPSITWSTTLQLRIITPERLAQALSLGSSQQLDVAHCVDTPLVKLSSGLANVTVAVEAAARTAALNLLQPQLSTLSVQASYQEQLGVLTLQPMPGWAALDWSQLFLAATETSDIQHGLNLQSNASVLTATPQLWQAALHLDAANQARQWLSLSDGAPGLWLLAAPSPHDAPLARAMTTYLPGSISPTAVYASAGELPSTLLPALSAISLDLTAQRLRLTSQSNDLAAEQLNRLRFRLSEDPVTAADHRSVQLVTPRTWRPDETEATGLWTPLSQDELQALLAIGRLLNATLSAEQNELQRTLALTLSWSQPVVPNSSDWIITLQHGRQVNCICIVFIPSSLPFPTCLTATSAPQATNSWSLVPTKQRAAQLLLHSAEAFAYLWRTEPMDTICLMLHDKLVMSRQGVANRHVTKSLDVPSAAFVRPRVSRAWLDLSTDTIVLDLTRPSQLEGTTLRLQIEFVAISDTASIPVHLASMYNDTRLLIPLSNSAASWFKLGAFNSQPSSVLHIPEGLVANAFGVDNGKATVALQIQPDVQGPQWRSFEFIPSKKRLFVSFSEPVQLSTLDVSALVFDPTNESFVLPTDGVIVQEDPMFWGSEVILQLDSTVNLQLQQLLLQRTSGGAQLEVSARGPMVADLSGNFMPATNLDVRSSFVILRGALDLEQSTSPTSTHERRRASNIAVASVSAVVLVVCTILLIHRQQSTASIYQSPPHSRRTSDVNLLSGVPNVLNLGVELRSRNEGDPIYTALETFSDTSTHNGNLPPPPRQRRRDSLQAEFPAVTHRALGDYTAVSSEELSLRANQPLRVLEIDNETRMAKCVTKLGKEGRVPMYLLQALDDMSEAPSRTSLNSAVRRVQRLVLQAKRATQLSNMLSAVEGEDLSVDQV